MLGRANISENLDTKPLVEQGTASDEVLQTPNQLIAVARARAIIMASDAEHIIRTGISLPLRSNSDDVFQENESVFISQRLMQERSSRRNSGYKVLAFTGRHVIVERGAKVAKIPSHMVRRVVT